MHPNQKTLCDSIRSLLYGTNDMLSEVCFIADMLAEVDGVPADDGKNRLLLALRTLKNGYQRANEMHR